MNWLCRFRIHHWHAWTPIQILRVYVLGHTLRFYYGQRVCCRCFLLAFHVSKHQTRRRDGAMIFSKRPR